MSTSVHGMHAPVTGNWYRSATIPPGNYLISAADKTETNNLAAQYPEKVQQLQALWYQWAQTHQVFPKPGGRKQ